MIDALLEKDLLPGVKLRDRDPGFGKTFAVKLFEHANHTGQVRNFNEGKFLLSDFNDTYCDRSTILSE